MKKEKARVTPGRKASSSISVLFWLKGETQSGIKLLKGSGSKGAHSHCFHGALSKGLQSVEMGTLSFLGTWTVG